MWVEHVILDVFSLVHWRRILRTAICFQTTSAPVDGGQSFEDTLNAQCGEEFSDG